MMQEVYYAEWLLATLGAFPTGRVYVLHGAPDTGKSAFARYLAKEVKNQNAVTYSLYINAERKGVDLVSFDEVLETNSLEEVVEVLIKKDHPTVAIIDSLDALAYESGGYGGAKKASYLSMQFPLILKWLATTRSILIVIAQARDNVSTGRGLRIAGGRALQHYSSLTLRFNVTSTIETNRKTVGLAVKVTPIKNHITGYMTPFHLGVYKGTISPCITAMLNLEAFVNIPRKGAYREYRGSKFNNFVSFCKSVYPTHKSAILADIYTSYKASSSIDL